MAAAIWYRYKCLITYSASNRRAKLHMNHHPPQLACKDFRNGEGNSSEQRHIAILDEQRKVISTLITTNAPVFKHQSETESTQKLPSLPQSYITETGKTRRLLFQIPNGVIENRLKGPAGGPQSKSRCGSLNPTKPSTWMQGQQYTQLADRLGYLVLFPGHSEPGRTESTWRTR